MTTGLALLVLGCLPVAGQTLFVDDDGAQCPGALRTIQEAVARASRGTTILVCPGTYLKTVVVKGHDKDAIKLIALGHTDEVVLQGDHMEMNGFHLEDVDNVVLRGFTVRDFGMGASETLPSGLYRAGMGNGIYLLNANFNTIENNRLLQNDMMGIDLWDSANNTIRYNLAFDNDTGGGRAASCYAAPRVRGTISFRTSRTTTASPD